MNWLIFALLAPLIYSAVNFADKYIIKSDLIDYRGMPIYTAIIGGLFGTLGWFIIGTPIIDFQNAPLISLSGILAILAYALYYKSISQETASKIILYIQITPVMVLILSFIFLEEVISSRQFIGFILIISAALGIVFTLHKDKLKYSKTPILNFLYILFADLLWASAIVILSYVTTTNHPFIVIIYKSWGLAIGGILLYGLFGDIRKSFLLSIKSLKRSTIGLVFANEGIFMVGKIFTIIAIAEGPGALVSVLGSTQVFFAILYGFILTKISPLIFEEDISRAAITKQLFLSIVMFCGVFLLI